MLELATIVTSLILSVPPADILTHGRMTNNAGAAVDGSYGVTVRLWDAATDGNELWSEDFAAVSVEQGHFAIPLEGVPIDSLSAAGDVWVGMQIEADPELPRSRLASAPYAMVATRALSISCSGCIPAAALSQEVNDIIDQAAASGSYTDEQAVTAVVNSNLFYTKTAAAILADLLPADGLDEVSGGLLSTTFEDNFPSADTPIDIADQNPLGSPSTIVVPNVGLAKDFEVTVEVEGHSDVSELKVSLFAPDGEEFLLFDKELAGSTGFNLKWPTVDQQQLEKFVGTNIQGSWHLKVVDDAFDTNTVDGTLKGWNISITTLSNQKVQFTGDFYGNGKQIKDLGAPTDDGDATNKGYVDASFKDRVFSEKFLAVAPGSEVTLAHSADTSLIFAQSWFRDPGSGQWSRNGAAVAGDQLGDGSDGAFEPLSNTNLAAGSYQFSSMKIPPNVTVTVTGNTPLVIKSTTNIEIQGNLLSNGASGGNINTSGINSSGGAGGPGGFAGGGSVYSSVPGQPGDGAGAGKGGPNGGYGGGGGGAGHGTQGTKGDTSGANCTQTGGGAGGSTVDSINADILVGGSGGGAGGYGSGANSAGGGGGGGGGAVKLIAPAILITGKLHVNGGKGGNVTDDRDGGGGGGGAGGAIWLVSGSVSVEGSVEALGGSAGITHKSGCYGGDGGVGGNGRIRIVAFNVQGSTSPAAIGSASQIGITGTPLRTYQKNDNSVSVQNLSFIPLDIQVLVIVP